VQTFFGKRVSSSDVDVRTFLCKKHRIFLNLQCLGTDKEKGELSQCGHFADKGGGVNFSRFCADIVYGRPLIFLVNAHQLGS